MPFFPFTGVRLKNESRYGTQWAAISFFSDGAGGMFRVGIFTYYYANGTYFEERTYSGYVGDNYDVTNTNYDPLFNYGAPQAPYTTYAFSGPVTYDDMRTHLSSMSITWNNWSIPQIVSHSNQSLAHAEQSISPFNSGDSYFVISDSDPNYEGLSGFIVGETTHFEFRLTILTPIPCRIRWDNNNGTNPITYALTPGVTVNLPEIALNEGGSTHGVIDQVTFLPWA